MNFEEEALKLIIDKMLNKSGHFSICDVDKLGGLLGTNPSAHKDYKVLYALHCVDYKDMSGRMKAELPARIMAVLSAKFDSDLMIKAMKAVKGGEIKDLPETIEDSARIFRIK